MTGIDVDVQLTPPPDLELTISNLPASVQRGTAVQFQYTVTNAGATRVPNTNWFDGIYLSTDNVLDAGDVELDKVDRHRIFNDGDSLTLRQGAFLPPQFVGNYFLIVKTDVDNDIFELDKSNNLDVKPITLTGELPDLVVSNVTVPASATSGGSAVVSWTVANQGLGDATTSIWIDRIYLSTDETKSDDDILVGERSRFGGLPAGQSVAAEFSVAFPFAAFGSYHVLVVADGFGSVFESNETNNVGSAPINLSSPLSDLQVTAASISPMC